MILRVPRSANFFTTKPHVNRIIIVTGDVLLLIAHAVLSLSQLSTEELATSNVIQSERGSRDYRKRVSAQTGDRERGEATGENSRVEGDAATTSAYSSSHHEQEQNSVESLGYQCKLIRIAWNIIS